MSKRIYLSRGKFCIVDDSDYEELSQWKWYYDRYALRVDIKTKKQIPMHRQLIKVPKGLFVDHINRLKLDNRRCNLRIATSAQNQANRGIYGYNSTGLKGIYWRENTQKWESQIMHKGKTYFVGAFKEKKDAIKAYNEKAKELNGEFAWLNSMPA